MRKVNYTVRKNDGSEFVTADYNLATESGNRIVKTFLTDMKEETLDPQKLAEIREKNFKKILIAKKRSH
jgi:hypothetical protein